MTIGSGPFGPQIDVTGTSDITQLGGQVERILTSQLEEYGIDLHDGLGERANEPIVAPDRTVQKAMRYTVDGNDHIWYGDMDGQLVPAHSRVKKGGDARMAAMLRLRDRTERLLAIERDPNATDTAVDPRHTGTSMGSTTGSSHPTAGSIPKRTCACSTRTTPIRASTSSTVWRRSAPTGSKPKETCFPRGSSRRCLRCPNTWRNPSTRWPSASTVWDMWISTSSDDCSTPGTTSKPLKNSATSSL